jgi:hypothetical protein
VAGAQARPGERRERIEVARAAGCAEEESHV